MEPFSLSATPQDNPVDLSTSKSTFIPVPKQESNVKSSARVSENLNFQMSSHFPHLRFHSNPHHSSCNLEVAQRSCDDINTFDRITKHKDKMKESKSIEAKNCDFKDDHKATAGVSDSSNPATSLQQRHVRERVTDVTYSQRGFAGRSLPQKRKLNVDDSTKDYKSFKKRKVLNEEMFSHYKYPYDYFYNNLNPLDATLLNPVDPYYPALGHLDSSSSHSRFRNKQPSSQETESLLAAVQHSQMLYYSYCNQLFLNLQNKNLPALEELQQSDKKSDNDIRSVEIRPATNLSNSKSNQSSSQCDNYFKSEGKGETSVAVMDTRILPKPLQYSLEDQQISEAQRISTGKKRSPRALTGKHVRPGTGASLSTLISLREKIAKKRLDDDEESNNRS